MTENRLRSAALAAVMCLGVSAARAWDPNKPLIYEMRIAFETDNWINMYSTATVLSKSDNTVAFRVVANSTTTEAVYQLVVTTQGSVGIATSSPAGLFTVGNGTLTVLSNGNVGVGISNPQSLLNVNGTITASDINVNGNLNVSGTVNLTGQSGARVYSNSHSFPGHYFRAHRLVL